jgi:hypothetical protein
MHELRALCFFNLQIHSILNFVFMYLLMLTVNDAVATSFVTSMLPNHMFEPGAYTLMVRIITLLSMGTTSSTCLAWLCLHHYLSPRFCCLPPPSNAVVVAQVPPPPNPSLLCCTWWDQCVEETKCIGGKRNVNCIFSLLMSKLHVSYSLRL